MRPMIYVIAGLLVLAGCTHLKFPEIPEYKLSKAGPFIVSESPELWRVFERPVAEPSIKTMDFFVKNSSSGAQKLLFKRASVDINGEKSSILCQSLNQGNEDAVISAQEIFRVQCRMTIVPTPGNRLGQKDTVVKVEIPSEAGPGIHLERLYRIEEFQ